MVRRLFKLNTKIISWINYFGISKTKSHIQKIDGLGKDFEYVFENSGNYRELDGRILLNLERINIRYISIQI